MLKEMKRQCSLKTVFSLSDGQQNRQDQQRNIFMVTTALGIEAQCGRTSL